MSNNLICLNSFPKSGNTWLRSVISHLCLDGEVTTIPDKYKSDIFNSPTFALPDGRQVHFYKSHDAQLERKIDGVRVQHAAAVHIIRHPLDVFLSYLNFLHLDASHIPDAKKKRVRKVFATEFTSISEIENADLMWAYFGAFFVYGTLNPQFKSAGNWWDHSSFWRSNLVNCPVVFSIRYEDLLENGPPELYALGTFLGKSSEQVDAAFEAAERTTSKDGAFFWKRSAANYTTMVKPDLLQQFDKVFGARLANFGYSIGPVSKLR